MFLLKIVLCLISFCFVANDDFNYLTVLRDQLLKNSNYDKHARPVKNHLDTTNVNIRYIGIREVDLFWKDEHLTWDPASFANLNDTVFSIDEIWTPDVRIFDGSYGYALRKSFDKQLLRVYSDGRVVWEPKAIFVTRCNVDLTNYPNDIQKCDVSLSTPFYKATELNITLRGPSRKLWCPSYSNQKWKCLNATAIVFYGNETRPYNIFDLDIRLQRVDSFYKFLITYPYVAASLLGLCLFLTPITSKLRYLFAFWAILILLLQLTFIGYELGLGLLGIPNVVRSLSLNLLCISVLLIVCTLIEPFILDKERSHAAPPEFIVSILGSNLCRLVFRLQPEIQISSDGNQTQKEKLILEDWLLIALFIDRNCVSPDLI
ncbi:nicotinic acetylcholine receptor subunit beta3-like protein [Dinothrombium tinctorium]|uniref:Nicotinic acetylcholine receptor subunit beta3-like protein n=1 Tax=Dinothrombium tinctorium TaxID=1965070 RepID=A0A443QVB7_9ACAR|nr:nicotinic acetylcholine receptor subunit beta3-like protein [Dinothrombium tinctorium]